MSKSGTQTAVLGVAMGGILTLVGIGAYVVSDFASVTALIPAIFGILFVGLGVIARDERRQMLAIYGIGGLAVFGILGSLRGVSDIVALLSGDSVDSVVAAVSQGAMIVCCFVLVGGVVRYVLDNR